MQLSNKTIEKKFSVRMTILFYLEIIFVQNFFNYCVVLNAAIFKEWM